MKVHDNRYSCGFDTTCIINTTEQSWYNNEQVDDNDATISVYGDDADYAPYDDDRKMIRKFNITNLKSFLGLAISTRHWTDEHLQPRVFTSIFSSFFLVWLG